MGYPNQQQQQPGYAPDPWANGNVPTGSYDGADPFDNAIPDSRGQRVQLARPDGSPAIHTDGEPIFVSPPSLRTLGIGTLVIIVPKKIERDVVSKRPGAWKPTFNRITADVIVCDGQGRKFGGDPTRDLPDLLGPFPVPCVIEDMWIDKQGIIDRVESVLGTGFKIGRIVKVKTDSDRTAWVLNSPEYDPANPAAPANPERARQIVQSLRPLWQAYLDRQLPILNLKTLGEQYGVKPGATVQQTAPAASYSLNAPVSPNPYGQQQPQMAAPAGMQMQPQINQQAPPAWPPMQPGQNMAPMQQQPAQALQALQALQAPISAPAAPQGDWTLQVALPAALEAFRPMWGTMEPAHREMMLAQAGVVRPGAGAYEQQPAATAAPAGPYAAPPPY